MSKPIKSLRCLQNTATDKALALGRMKIAVHNLFQMINKHAKQPESVTVDDTELQLEKVRKNCFCLNFGSQFEYTDTQNLNKMLEARMVGPVVGAVAL